MACRTASSIFALVFTGRGVGVRLGRRREVDAVEARPLDRRRGDAHVDLDGADYRASMRIRARWVFLHDRIDDDEPLADDLTQRVEQAGCASCRMVCEGWMVRPT